MEAAVEEAGIHSILADLTQRAARARGGLPVRWLGDGVMFFFKRPGSAVLSALEMVQEAPGAGQVLVTDEVVAAAESDRVRYETLGPVRLKGSPNRSGFTWPSRHRSARPDRLLRHHS
jgi:class 3 adenylate cyclase